MAVLTPTEMPFGHQNLWDNKANILMSQLDERQRANRKKENFNVHKLSKRRVRRRDLLNTVADELSISILNVYFCAKPVFIGYVHLWTMDICDSRE